MRGLFRLWPLQRGRRWLLRLCEAALGSGPLRFEIGEGALVEGRLRDWIFRWTFMRLHERDEPFQHSLALLDGAGIIFDVGANVGVWSLLAAKRNPAARIHAFEPAPATAAQLRRHVELNQAAITVVECAVGADETSRPFFAHTEGNTGASSFYREAGGVALDVPVTTLDAYAECEDLPRVDVIKVDAEGAEMLVFRGARRLMSSETAPAVFFEMSDQLCERSGATVQQVKQLLLDHGYQVYRWRQHRFARVPVDESHTNEDLFALKPQHLG
jgi:FkbM family methyltransferase